MVDIDVNMNIDDIAKGLNVDFRNINDFTVPLLRSATVMLKSTQENFDKESTPDGKKWPDIKRATKAARARKIKSTRRKTKSGAFRAGSRSGIPKILQEEGVLKESAGQSKLDGKDKLIITARRESNGVDIAPVHQFGSSKNNIPQRKFLGFSEQDADDIAKVFGDWAAKKLGAR